MNKGLIFTFGILIGGAGGGLLVNMMLKQQYAQKADEEIAACRNAFLTELEKRREEVQKKEHEEKKEAAAEAMKKYSQEPEKAAETIRNSDNKPKTKPPYIIPPEVFDDPNNPYPTTGFMYYSNGVIAREDGTIIDMDDLDVCVGRESLTHFGEHEEDRVCIRNEALNRDYEIVLLDKPYAEPGK